MTVNNFRSLLSLRAQRSNLMPRGGSRSQRTRLPRSLRSLAMTGTSRLRRFSRGNITGLNFDEYCRRLRVLGLGVFTLQLLVIGRLVHLQLAKHNEWLSRAMRQHGAQFEIQGARGTILDREGRLLAISVPAISVGAHLRSISDREEFASRVAPMLPMSEPDLRRLVMQEKPFVWLARGLAPELGERLRGESIVGLSVFPEFKRYYPQGAMLSPILGLVGRDGHGLSGIEGSFERKLAAGTRQVPVQRDARGAFVRRLEDRVTESSPIDTFRLALNPVVMSERVFREEGDALSLTVDSYIQQILEEEFAFGKTNAKARRVFGLVVDAESGEVLGAAQSENFDPHQLQRIDPATLQSAILADNFEPGSTLKPIVAAIALERGVIQPRELIDCENGTFPVAGHTIRDVHPVATVPFEQVLIQSSNICMAKVGFRLGKRALYEGLAQFGFGKSTGIELAGEAQGILRDYRSWVELDTATHAFGQGIAVSALQMVQAYSAIANGGYIVEPTIIKDPENHSPKRTRVMSEKTANVLGEILTQVTASEHGTGRQAAISGVRVAGKTGTAQKAHAGGRGYNPDEVLASFIGFVDGNAIGIDRKFTLLVVVDEPGVKPRWGGTVAAPIYGRAMQRILSYLLTTESRSIQTAGLVSGKLPRT